MNPKLKFFLRIIAIFIVVLIIIQPYNFFCNLTSKCQPINLASLLPTREGNQEVELKFGTKNYVDKLDIKPEIPTLLTVSGRKNTVRYIAKNNSGHFMRFRMEFYTAANDLKDNIKIYQCPCSGQKRLKKDEEVILTTEFEINDEAVDMLKDIPREDDIEAAEIIDKSNKIIGFKVIPF